MFVTKLQEALSSRRTFIADRLNFVGLALSLLINIIHWLILYIKIKPTNTRILLHYNVLIGSDIVSAAKYIYLLPILALFFLILNTIVAAVFYKKEKLPSYFLNLSSIVVQIIFLIASMVLVVANES